MSPDLGWKIETTWNWLLQTMLALKSLPTEHRPGKPRVNYGTGLHTLHHLLMLGSHLTTWQKKNAWFILGREEIPDLYAQLHDTDRNAAVGMAAVLEGHTQAISRVSRDQATEDQVIIYLPEPLPPGRDMPTRLDTGQRSDRRHAKMDTPANQSRPMGLSEPYEIRDHYYVRPISESEYNG